MAEIIGQAQNLEMYWANLLMVGPLGRRYTATLIAIGLAVGHMVGMHWKHRYARARPVQVFPGLLPVILTPAHPSYPSNHSLQSQLVARVLLSIFQGGMATRMKAPLIAMANRIGLNREVAGVHFPSDTEAGKLLAERVFPLLQQVPSFNKVLAAARAEWTGVTATELRPANVTLSASFADQVAARVVNRLKRVQP